MFRNLFQKNKEEAEWISISDLMAGLMMIFLFIAISFMNSLQLRANQIREVAVAYRETQYELYQALFKEFEHDLTRWQAEIDPQLIVRFNEPRVLFHQNSSEVTPFFKEVLRDFFPRYLKILYSDKYRENIEEIRIEGHTSSEWQNLVDRETSYYLNMKLSQDRTRSVLEHCLRLSENQKLKSWVRGHLTANGLSSSRLILTNGHENKKRSRRVEFRTKTKAHEKIVQIIEELEKT